MTFADLGLSENTIKAINDAGIFEPTTVQTDVIPSILEGKDVFTIAPQGCGKTCSYVFPLVDILARNQNQTILILTADSKTSATVSDRITTFNRYHEEKADDDAAPQANVIIASPNLLLSWQKDGDNFDLSQTSVLIVDDINLIKKKKQLQNLEKVLELLPAEQQNIVYTNRRSQETQEILEKILKTPQEIKVNKDKEQEAQIAAPKEESKPCKKEKKCPSKTQKITADEQSLDLVKKYDSFAGKTPEFLLYKGQTASEE